MRPRLRLFTGEDNTSTALQEPQVSIKLGEIAQILTEASRWDRTWLSDFEDDAVQVSADLYEVLSAYSHLRPSA